MKKQPDKKTDKKKNTKARLYRNRIIKITSLILAIVVTALFLQEFILCNPNHNTERVRGYYLEDENSLDVIVVGSSEVYCCYSAGLAYRECGFTSYPYATEGNTVRNFKTIFDEIRRTQDSKLIVFEINGAIYGDKNIDKEVNLRRVTDNMPLNDNKVELVEKGATSDQIEYYVPFIKYHGAWDTLHNTIGWSISLIQDKLRGYNLLKGVKNRTLTYVPDTKVYTTAELQKRRPLFRKSDEELKEFLQYLVDVGYDKEKILFIRVPHITTNENITRYQRGNSIADTIRRYGFNFVSFEADDPEIGIDVNKDFYNIEHMNVYGLQKFSKFFAHYLQDNYNITPSELTEEQKEEWEKAGPYYDAYVKYNEQLFSEGKDIEVAENYQCMREINKLVQ